MGRFEKGPTMTKMTEERAPRFESGRAMQIAGLGGRFGNHNRAQIPALWQRFGPQYFGRVPGQVDRKSYGVCWNMDLAGNVDYLAGVEVSSFVGLLGRADATDNRPAALRRSLRRLPMWKTAVVAVTSTHIQRR